MKMKIGSYKIRAGYYTITKDFRIPEFAITGPGLWLDVDWTNDNKFPVGWCAGLNLGKKIWYTDQNGIRRGPFQRWNSHWSWNAPHGEPNRFGVTFGWFSINFSCFTWWKEIVDSVEEGRISPRTGKPARIYRMHRERSWPYLEDGWPIVRFQRKHFEKGEPDDSRRTE